MEKAKKIIYIYIIEMGKKSDIICIFVPYGVEPTFSEKDYPYKWEDEDGTYYSIMSKEEYLAYIEWEWD